MSKNTANEHFSLKKKNVRIKNSNGIKIIHPKS